MDRSMVEARRQWFDLEDENGRKQFLIQLDQLILLLDTFQREKIECLLKESLNNRYNYGVRIVSLVAQTGYRNDPDVDENVRPSSSRTTALHHAGTLVYSRAHPVVQELFKIYHRFDLNYTDVESGLTHFHIACKFGCEQVVRRFLELGQDPNLVARDTVDPPLHSALLFGHENVARLLLRNRADPNLADKNGSTALHVICTRHNDDVRLLEMLFDTCAEKAVQVNAKDIFDQTPLHIAVTYDNKNVAKILLEKGADPNATNREGSSPLHVICARHIDDDFADKFIKMAEDLNINSQDTDGNTPLHLALGNGLIGTAQILVEEGADLLLTNEKGVTPLHIGCKRRDTGFINAIGRPSNIDAQDRNGDTAYHLALRNGHEKVALWLLARGANTTRANNEGLTPLHTVCQRYQFDDLIQILTSIGEVECELDFRARVTARDSSGRNALDLAVSRLLPNEGNGLLRHFHFDTERYLPYPYGDEQRTMVCEQKLDATCDVLTIVEYFWGRGCLHYGTHVLSVINFFHYYGLFKRSGEFRVHWYDDQEFVSRAERIMIRSELSLNDFVRLPLEQASSSRVINYDIILIIYNLYLNQWPKGPKDACIVHFCELLAWSFFREWALYYFQNLLGNRLSNEICCVILDMLEMKDFAKICWVGVSILPSL